MSRIEEIEEAYRRHHSESRTTEFVFCEPERSVLFREWVGGPGRKVLDLGCRFGALTRAYLPGNEAVAVDVDREALAGAEKLGNETAWAEPHEPLPSVTGASARAGPGEPAQTPGL